MIGLCLFVPCFPAFFNLLISFGQKRLMISLLKRFPNLGPLGLIPHSSIKLLEFVFNQSKGAIETVVVCCIQKAVDEA